MKMKKRTNLELVYKTVNVGVILILGDFIPENRLLQTMGIQRSLIGVLVIFVRYQWILSKLTREQTDPVDAQPHHFSLVVYVFCCRFNWGYILVSTDTDSIEQYIWHLSVRICRSVITSVIASHQM